MLVLHFLLHENITNIKFFTNDPYLQKEWNSTEIMIRKYMKLKYGMIVVRWKGVLPGGFFRVEISTVD